MSEVETLFAERRRAIALADAMGCPVQTVYSWKRKGAIPAWRRSAVLEAARQLEIALPDQVVEYLDQRQAA